MNNKKTVIVTGVSRGLGASLATQLDHQGFNLVGLGRTGITLGPQFKFYAVDFARLDEANQTLQKVFRELALQEHESITLIHNAAVSLPIGLIQDLSSQDIRSSFDINLTGPVCLSQVFLKSFEKIKAPKKIIHVSSGAAARPIPGSNIYCIAKAGLEMLVKGIHSEAQYQAHAVTCIGFRPGVIDTDMQTQLRTYSKEQLPVVDMYRDFQTKGLLRTPDSVAKMMINHLIEGPLESGRVYSVDDFKV